MCQDVEYLFNRPYSTEMIDKNMSCSLQICAVLHSWTIPFDFQLHVKTAAL